MDEEKKELGRTVAVRVATEVVADRFYDYSVSEEMAPLFREGQRVRVPLGSRTVDAYVVELLTELPVYSDGKAEVDLFGNPIGRKVRRLRQVLMIEDEVPFLSRTLIELARWMADYTCTPFERVLRCMLPSVIRNHTVHAKEQFFVSPLEGEFTLTPRQRELYAEIRRVRGGWLHALVHEFSCSPETLKKLAAKGAVKLEKRAMRRDPLANRRILPSRPLPLMEEQAEALSIIVEALDHPETRRPVLLFGVTGSGKTEVYLQAIAHVLEQGKGAIVLVPEIALTPQTVQRFASRFGKRIAVLHSALGDGERFDEWHRIRTGEAVVVVGPRSALFAPVKNLGLIVVDEEHEPSYKQDEAPRYNARDLAVMRAHMEGCAVVLGSATPAMESWLNVRKGKYRIARMTSRVANRPMPSVQIVDMKVETARAGHAQIFSQVLLEALKIRLERGEQSILFLNRRGYSRSLTCPHCGYTATCEACDIAYTYHLDDNCLRCHICGDWKHVPDLCPVCHEPDFKYAGIGTQRAEKALQRCFPEARILRMDADVTARKSSHDEILSAFRGGKADILIGTQMIAKGLDFPNVTLVGVLSADTSLHIPDFRAAERTYQLLAQVSGRAGRAELPGEVYIQTYTPDHPAILAASSSSGFEPFAERELKDRLEGGYPPYTRLVCLTFRGKSDERVCFVSANFSNALKKRAENSPDMVICESCPAPLAKAKGFFRYQILLFAPSVRASTRCVQAVLAQFPLPEDISLAIDVDALDIC